MQRSPYTPGEVTKFLPGREGYVRQLVELSQDVADQGSFIGRPRVYIGGRGVGKTSLVRRAQAEARSRGLETVWITAGDADLVPTLTAQILALTRTWKTETAAEITRLAQNVEVTFKLPGVELKTRRGDASPIETSPGSALEELIGVSAQELRRQGRRGLAIFVDEMQAADVASLRALAYAWQHLKSWTVPVPAMLIGAGLGHTSDVVTEAATFGERFKFTRLRSLGEEAAFVAFSEPAESLGVTWRYDALRAARSKASGYPYFVQLCGDAAWEAAGNPDEGGQITLGAFEAAQDEIDEQLEVFFRTRWSKATPGERELLRAVAKFDGNAPRRKDVADAMGKTSTAISMARRSLMDKGILDSPERGRLSFTAPGFAQFIMEYDGSDD